MTYTNSSTCSHRHIDTHWHKYCDIQGHTDTPTNRSTSMHETPAHTHHTHTPPDPYAHTHSNKPPESPGSPAAVAHPPGGGDVPKRTEVSGPILSSAGSCMTSTATSLLPGVWSWGQAGARHRHFGPCWENRERLSCPLPVL